MITAGVANTQSDAVKERGVRKETIIQVTRIAMQVSKKRAVSDMHSDAVESGLRKITALRLAKCRSQKEKCI
jgi:hypothetical protein